MKWNADGWATIEEPPGDRAELASAMERLQHSLEPTAEELQLRERVRRALGSRSSLMAPLPQPDMERLTEMMRAARPWWAQPKEN